MRPPTVSLKMKILILINWIMLVAGLIGLVAFVYLTFSGTGRWGGLLVMGTFWPVQAIANFRSLRRQRRQAEQKRAASNDGHRRASDPCPEPFREDC